MSWMEVSLIGSFSTSRLVCADLLRTMHLQDGGVTLVTCIKDLETNGLASGKVRSCNPDHGACLAGKYCSSGELHHAGKYSSSCEP